MLNAFDTELSKIIIAYDEMQPSNPEVHVVPYIESEDQWILLELHQLVDMENDKIKT